MRKRRILTLLALACGMLALWAHALISLRALETACPGLGVRIADTPVPGKRLRLLLQEDAPGGLVCTAAWTRGKPVAAEAESMQTTARLRVIAVYGDMRQAALMTLLSGSFPTEDDWGGCLLDADSAQALFHSADVVGARVEIAGTRYTVRGVVKCGEPMALIRGENASYENLEFAVSDFSAGKAAADALLYRYTLSGDYAVVQSGLYVRILRGLAVLPAAVPLLIAAVCLLRRALRLFWEKRPFCMLPMAAAIACGAGAVLLLRAVYWPQSFLPTKCSDFVFWGTLLDGWKADWNALCLMTPLPKDVRFFRAMRECVCSLAAAAGLEIALCARIMTGLSERCVFRQAKAHARLEHGPAQ